MNGRIHSFQSMGAVDGPGLRYVVFLQGCPLRCAYCHNPDTWDKNGGQSFSVEEVLSRVRRYQTYIRPGGGVTVTGGEPLMQWEFTAELFAALQAEGYHTALDTSGAGNLHGAIAVLKHTDLVLADVKFTSEDDYKTYTGGSLAQTLGFLQLTREMGVPLWIRHVAVPGLTDSTENIMRLADIAEKYDNLQRIELLPFHKLCLEKYKALGLPFPLADTPAMTTEALSPLREILRQRLPKLYIAN